MQGSLVPYYEYPYLTDVRIMAKPNLAKFRRINNVQNTGQLVISSFFSKNTKLKERPFAEVSIFFVSLPRLDLRKFYMPGTILNIVT